jgi:hypothetical protein
MPPSNSRTINVKATVLVVTLGTDNQLTAEDPSLGRSAQTGVGEGCEPRQLTVFFEARRRVINVSTEEQRHRRHEERVFEESLRKHGQLVDDDNEELPSGATHRVVTDNEGRRVIRRERFSAI